jgi:hypothetical protein
MAARSWSACTSSPFGSSRSPAARCHGNRSQRRCPQGGHQGRGSHGWLAVLALAAHPHDGRAQGTSSRGRCSCIRVPGEWQQTHAHPDVGGTPRQSGAGHGRSTGRPRVAGSHIRDPRSGRGLPPRGLQRAVGDSFETALPQPLEQPGIDLGASSSASRVLPIPGSPRHSTNRGRPAQASAKGGPQHGQLPLPADEFVRTPLPPAVQRGGPGRDAQGATVHVPTRSAQARKLALELGAVSAGAADADPGRTVGRRGVVRPGR